MFKHVHHVHYLVENHDAMVQYIEKTFGMKPNYVTDDLERHRKEALYDVDKTQIQITEPTNPATAMGQHLAKNGPGVFHVGWAVDNIHDVAKDLAAQGNKLRLGGMQDSPRGYVVSNIEPSSSLG